MLFGEGGERFLCGRKELGEERRVDVVEVLYDKSANECHAAEQGKADGTAEQKGGGGGDSDLNQVEMTMIENVVIGG